VEDCHEPGGAGRTSGGHTAVTDHPVAARAVVSVAGTETCVCLPISVMPLITPALVLAFRKRGTAGEPA
jgi:hypothetical protein